MDSSSESEPNPIDTEMPDIASGVVAVVLSYERADQLGETLSAVCAQKPRPARVVVVDNGSRDGSAEVARSVPGVDVVALGRNVGVGAGHRIGWERALETPGASAVWVLEHDSVPQPGCLNALAGRRAALERDGARVGVVAARLERNAEEAASRLEWDEDLAARPIDRFTFNAVLVTRDVIETVGFPRDDFFVGQEDWDYSRRVLDAGFAVWEEADALALHPTKGDDRFGIRPSVARSYYANRNWLYMRCRDTSESWSRTKSLGWTLGASGRTVLHEDRKLRRLCARWMAYADAVSGRLGPRDYWFLQRPRRGKASARR